MQILMTQTNLERIEGKMKIKSGERRFITEKEYDLITNPETMAWFKAIGGKDTIVRGRTKYAQDIIELTSVSPDGCSKTVREFEFVE